MSHKPLLVIAAILCCSIVSCKKAKQASPTTYDINVSGILFTYDTVYFSSTAPAGSKLQWDFGDSVTSSDTSPYHIFTDSDSFIVTLIVNNDKAHPVKKTVFINEVSYHWSGKLMVGLPISFTATVPPGTSVIWDFGDSTTSSSADVTHIFTHPRSYWGKIIMDYPRPFTAQFMLKIVEDPFYTSQLEGTRSYHNKSYFWVSGPFADTSVTVKADASLILHSIDQITVSVDNKYTLTFSGQRNDTLFYESSYGNGDYNNHGTYLLMFNHVTNKTAFVNYGYVKHYRNIDEYVEY